MEQQAADRGVVRTALALGYVDATLLEPQLVGVRYGRGRGCRRGCPGVRGSWARGRLRRMGGRGRLRVLGRLRVVGRLRGVGRLRVVGRGLRILRWCLRVSRL
ncbi:hypothetical protein SANT12839_055170 [Streptomyces antimycoticus]|uniref:Uncharacterized protein n=1 Tax=Streptomyces antimycoticus TaxID=68175 RepID=A0A4D4K6T0_9ACTN|nr:hypothetical protein SANT12839_055170 [Streptomyces antimycoticus]